MAILTHIWACKCGHEAECEPEEQRAGAVYECQGCKQIWGGVRSIGRGCTVWIPIKPDQEEFYDFFGRQMEACDQKYEAQMADLEPNDQDVVHPDEDRAI